MRFKKNPALLTGGLLALALPLAACGGSGASSAPVAEGEDLVIDGELIADADTYAAALEEGSLVFYTGASEQSEADVAEAFTESTGIDVEIVRLAPNKLNERILSEAAADKLGADLIRISGEDLIKGIANAGAFTELELTDDITSGLFESTVSPDGLFASSYDRLYSFGYNNQLIDAADAPEDWADLLDPDLSGVTGIVQVGAGGSTAALTRFQLDVLGEDWLRDYAAAEPRIYDSSAALTDGLARGEISVGTIPIATAYSASLDGAPITIATPEEGAAAYPFYIGVSASAKSPNAARVFANWLLSSEAQELAASMGDYPVREGMPTTTIGDVELPPADSGFAYRVSVDEALEHIEPDAQLWTSIFGYTG